MAAHAGPTVRLQVCEHCSSDTGELNNSVWKNLAMFA